MIRIVIFLLALTGCVSAGPGMFEQTESACAKKCQPQKYRYDGLHGVCDCGELPPL